MRTWTFEPGHTEVRFRARHMMVTYVDGLFKDVQGWLQWDPNHPEDARCEATIDARRLWTGEEQRDAHLRSPDFFDVESHPTITFASTDVKQRSETELLVQAEITLRGISRPVTANVFYVGSWDTPYWESKNGQWRDFGPVRRVGFTGALQVNRHDWNVSWQDTLHRGGVVVSDEIDLRLDVEALRDEDVARAKRELEQWTG